MRKILLSLFFLLIAIYPGALGLFAQSTGGIGIQPISRGGTGANNITDARSNLGFVGLTSGNFSVSTSGKGLLLNSNAMAISTGGTWDIAAGNTGAKLSIGQGASGVFSFGTNSAVRATFDPVTNYTTGGLTQAGAGRWYIGANAASTDDSAIKIGRAITGSILTGAHAIRDESTVSQSGGGLLAYASFDAIPVMSGAVAYNHLRGFQSRPNFSGTSTIDELSGIQLQPTVASGTVTNVYFVRIDPVLKSGAGTGTVGFLAGINIGDVGNTAASSSYVTPSNPYAIYSGSTAPSYFGGTLQSGGLVKGVSAQFTGLGTAYGQVLSGDGSGNLLPNPNLTIINGVLTMGAGTAKVFATATDLDLYSQIGQVRLAPVNAVTLTLDPAYALLTTALRQGAKTTKYNNIDTVGNGVPAEYAEVNLTNQSAAVAATTIYTPPADGFYRLSAVLKITTAGTSPVAGPITITYNDGDGNVAQSQVMLLKSTTGTVVTTTVNNSTTTGTVNGDMVFYAKSGTAIQYAIAVSGTFGSGRYSAHLKLEAM